MKKCLFKCLIVAIALNLFVSAYYQIADRLGYPVQPEPTEQIHRASLLSTEFIENDDFSSRSRVKAETIYHNGRAYDVFYHDNDSRFFVIRVK
jgi:hypothetical protein